MIKFRKFLLLIVIILYGFLWFPSHSLIFAGCCESGMNGKCALSGPCPPPIIACSKDPDPACFPQNQGVRIGSSFNFGGKGIDQIFPDLASLINVLLPNVYVLAGLILLILLIFGGLTYILNAGKKPEEMAKGSQALTAALMGFVIIFIAYWIINIVNYLLPITEVFK